MATYPGGIYSPRTKVNRSGVVYDATKETVIFAEDIQKDDAEIVAVETELGTNPKGAYASVAAFLVDLLVKVKVCDNGATAPASPVTGQWFLHTPTGRKILMMYSGSAWIPIISIGTMVVYVDGTDGTDVIDKGGTTTTGAFKTLQYANNAIPGLIGGNISIYLSATTYDEQVIVRGKKFTGNYSISIVGTLTQVASLVATGGGKGATSTPATVTGTFTANAYQHKLLKFTSGSNNNLYRIVDKNDTTTITLVGRALTADPVNDDTYIIYDWGTQVTKITVDRLQDGVVLYYLKMQHTSSPIALGTVGSITIYRSWVVCTASAGLGVYATEQATVTTYDTLFEATGGGGCRVLAFYEGADLVMNSCKIKGTDSGTGIYLEQLAMARLESSFIEDFATGIHATMGAVGKYYCTNVYNRITSCPTYGLRAEKQGLHFYTSHIVFTTCGTDKSVEAASYSYTD